MAEDLKLESSFMHTQFSSWRLQRLAIVNRFQLCATGHASGVATTALDFLHTRASVLRNHLLQSEGRLFIFTQSEHRPGYFVYELLPAPTSDQGLLASQVAELGPDAGEGTAGGAVEAVVDCSLAVVAPAATPPAAAAAAAVEASDASGLTPAQMQQQDHPQQQQQQQQQLLLSRGHGDVVLMRRSGSGGEHVSYSHAVHPLRPRLPCTGVRPLVLEAAFEAINGDITAIVWAMRSKGGPHQAACCEVFAVTLRPSAASSTASSGAAPEHQAQGAPEGAPLHLATVGVRLLLRTKLPPYLVRVLPSEPSASDDGSGGSGGRVVLLGFDPNSVGLEDEEAEGGHVPMQVTAPLPGGVASIDDDDDDMDPRTLEQAAARLAHMTSGEREAAAPPPQWADIYKESGPDGVGAMGDEPGIDLAAWRLLPPAGGSGGDGGASGGDNPLAPLWRLSCGAHKLLTAEGPVRQATQPPPQLQPQQPLPQQQPLLLGVTDDVDCAVLRVDAWGGSAGTSGRGGGGGGVQVRHAVSIPALAYVAAGKTYKRHLLLSSAGTDTTTTTTTASIASGASADGGGGGGTSASGLPLAAVLVESQRFMYLYGTTSTREEYGKQQVVELGLEEGESVLGARLVEVPGGKGEMGEAREVLVVLATQQRLLSYRLRM